MIPDVPVLIRPVFEMSSQQSTIVAVRCIRPLSGMDRAAQAMVLGVRQDVSQPPCSDAGAITGGLLVAALETKELLPTPSLIWSLSRLMSFTSKLTMYRFTKMNTFVDVSFLRSPKMLDVLRR
jgi:hypothetical protein